MSFREGDAMSVLQNPELEKRLAVLHAKSDEQLEAMKVYYALRDKERKLSASEQAAQTKLFLSDKLVALDRDKAEFCYQLLRSINARRVVEIGTQVLL